MMSTAQFLAQRVAAEHLAEASNNNNQSAKQHMRHLPGSENTPINPPGSNVAQAQAELAQQPSASAAAAGEPASAYSLAMMAAQNALEDSSSSPASNSAPQATETHAHTHASVGQPSTSSSSAGPSGAHALAMMAAQSALENPPSDPANAEAVTSQDVQQMTHEAQLKQFLTEGELQTEMESARNGCPTSERNQNRINRHLKRRPRRSSDYVTDHPSSHGKPVTISTTAPSKHTGSRRYSQNDALDMSSDEEENSVSDISTASRNSRSNSLSMSRNSSLSGNLSGGKRPSSESLSVTGHLQRVLGASSDGSDSSALGGRHSLSRTMSSKRSRGSLRSFRSNLGMVGENSTLLASSNNASGEGTKSNADWNLEPQHSGRASTGQLLQQHHAGSSAVLHRPPSSSAMHMAKGSDSLRNMLLEHARQESNLGLKDNQSNASAPSSSNNPMHDVLLQKQPISTSAQNMSALSARDVTSNASLSRATNTQRLSNNALASQLASMGSRTSISSSASGPVSAPKPNNPFLGGGSTSAAANFLNLLGPGPTAAPPGSRATVAPVSASGPSGPSPPMAKIHGLSSATQDFIGLLQQPSGIHSVQALIQSQHRQVQARIAPGNGGDSVKDNVEKATYSKIPSVVGTCRGSTPTKKQEGINVTDGGRVVQAQTASEAHQAQTDSKDISDRSPQELLVATIKARGGDPTIRPALSIIGKFHNHTEEEIAAYPPTAMLVRNNDLAGLKMALQSGSKLQTSNKFGESLLHIACRRGYDHIARYLIEDANVTVWVRDDFGRTPCHDACWTAKPNLELMDLLVRICPEMLLMSDKRGSTPLDYVRRDNWDVWRNFLEDRWDIIIPKKA